MSSGPCLFWTSLLHHDRCIVQNTHVFAYRHAITWVWWRSVIKQRTAVLPRMYKSSHPRSTSIILWCFLRFGLSCSTDVRKHYDMFSRALALPVWRMSEFVTVFVHRLCLNGIRTPLLSWLSSGALLSPVGWPDFRTRYGIYIYTYTSSRDLFSFVW